MPTYRIQNELNVEISPSGRGFVARVYIIGSVFGRTVDTTLPVGEAVDTDPYRALGKAMVRALDKLTGKSVSGQIDALQPKS